MIPTPSSDATKRLGRMAKEVRRGTRLHAITRHVLERQGYAVVEAPDGKTAMSLAGRHPGPIHLLLTDVIMPAMNGPELAAQLKEARPGLKVMYMSGYTDDAVVRLGVLERQVVYLQKPFTAEGLARKVREALDSAGEAGHLLTGGAADA